MAIPDKGARSTVFSGSPSFSGTSGSFIVWSAQTCHLVYLESWIRKSPFRLTKNRCIFSSCFSLLVSVCCSEKVIVVLFQSSFSSLYFLHLQATVHKGEDLVDFASISGSLVLRKR
jgi:hypothetical protein